MEEKETGIEEESMGQVKREGSKGKGQEREEKRSSKGGENEQKVFYLRAQSIGALQSVQCIY